MGNPEDEARERYEAGRAQLDAGDRSGAIAELETSVSEYPHFKALELLGEASVARGRPARAVTFIAAATTLNAQVRAPSLLAEALLALGEELKAYEVAKLALDRDPPTRRLEQSCR